MLCQKEKKSSGFQRQAVATNEIYAFRFSQLVEGLHSMNPKQISSPHKTFTFSEGFRS